MADVFELGEEAIQLAELAIIGVLAYLAYRAYELFSGSGSNCGPDKDQQCCSPSDINTAACLNADGSAGCGYSGFFSRSCYQASADVVAQVNQAREQSSATSGAADIIGSWYFPWSDAYSNLNTVPAAPTPGLPVGYDPTTGTINPTASGTAGPGPFANLPDPYTLP